MNRKEDLINYLYEELFDPANEEIGFDRVISTIREYEESPLTLADLLGWEEGVEYRYRNHKYKICEGVLLIYNKNANCWYEAYERIKDYSRLQGATRVEKI